MLSSVRKPPPQVTGISPKEGPPGTKVTIRGENLGVDARDIIGKLRYSHFAISKSKIVSAYFLSPSYVLLVDDNKL